MPENTQQAHLIGFPATRAHDHSHYIQGFVYACEAEGKSRATVVSYRENLDRFLKAVRDLGLPQDPRRVTRDDVRRYLSHLRGGGYSTATVNGRLAVLRLWFKWLQAEGVVEEEPTAKIAKAKEDRRVLATLTPLQVEDLLRVCKREAVKGPQARRKAERDRAIILTLYNTGLRASELVNLDLGDVDFERMLVHVRHGKGRKERVVYLGTVARQALWRYVSRVRGSTHGPLFRAERGDRLLRTSLTQLLTKLAKKTGWQNKECHPHMFRRAFAVEFLRNGGDPFRLQLLLGHEKLDMTRLYSQALSMDDALEAHEKFGPADRLRL